MQVKAKLSFIGEVRDVSDKFKVRSFILRETWPTRLGGEQESFIPMQVTQGNCGLLDGMEVRDEIVVQFNFDGRMANDVNQRTGEPQAFLNLTAYQIDLATPRENAGSGEAKSPEPQQPPLPTKRAVSQDDPAIKPPDQNPQQAPFPTQPPPKGDEEPTDLPF